MSGGVAPGGLEEQPHGVNQGREQMPQAELQAGDAPAGTISNSAEGAPGPRHRRAGIRGSLWDLGLCFVTCWATENPGTCSDVR